MKRWVKYLLIFVVLAAGWALLAPALATWLIVEKPLEHADAIIVLSGSAVYVERTTRAFELYKQGIAPRIFVTDDGGRSGWSSSERENPSFVGLEQIELLKDGVEADAITVLPGNVTGTDSEANAI